MCEVFFVFLAHVFHSNGDQTYLMKMLSNRSSFIASDSLPLIEYSSPLLQSNFDRLTIVDDPFSKWRAFTIPRLPETQFVAFLSEEIGYVFLEPI